MSAAMPRSETIDVEELAVRAGIKPALRATISRDEIPAFEAGAARRGLVVRVARFETTYLEARDARWVPVYVARTAEQADALRDAEEQIHSGSVGTREAATIRAGLALGYPRCCAESFARSRRRYGGAGRLPAAAAPWLRRLASLRHLAPRRRSGTLTPLELGLVDETADDYLYARDRWCPAPDARLNNLTFRLRARLISHTPCSYRCAASIAYADRVAAAVEQVMPAALERIRRVTARPILVAPSTARVHVEIHGGRITHAEPLVPADVARGMEPALELDRVLARAAIGRRVEDFGLVWLRGTFPAAVLLAFR